MSIMWICKKCGNLIEEVALKFDHVPIDGRSYPVKAYQTECPCGGDLVHALRCGMCGEWFADEDLTDGLCAPCFDRFYNVDYALEHDAREFLYYVFGDEANKILARELQKKPRMEVMKKAAEFYREAL